MRSTTGRSWSFGTLTISALLLASCRPVPPPFYTTKMHTPVYLDLYSPMPEEIDWVEDDLMKRFERGGMPEARSRMIGSMEVHFVPSEFPCYGGPAGDWCSGQMVEGENKFGFTQLEPGLALVANPDAYGAYAHEMKHHLLWMLYADTDAGHTRPIWQD